MLLVDAEKKIAGIVDESERNVAHLLLNMGFSFLECNQKILNSDEKNIGEIDLLFTFEDYLFLIEVSKDRHSGSSKKISFFSKWDRKENLNSLRKQFHLSPRKVQRIYFDLATKKKPENSSVELDMITKKTKMNKIAYLDDYEYFVNCTKKIGSWAKNDFLDWLDFEDEKKSKVIDAIQYYIGEIPVFCFVEKVESLLHTCYVSRRRTNDVGYQRTLKENRVVGISKNIKKGDGLSFPNSILINAPDLSDEILPPEECPKAVKIRFPLSYNTCRIIDGQHRLLGFSVVPSEIRKMYSLPVIALQDYDRKKEIKTFVDVNSKQQRIDGNLILLLKADLDWKENTTEFKEKIAVGVARELNDSFFNNRIYFGMSEETKGDKITLTTLVSALVRNNQVYDSVVSTNRKLREIFSYMQQYLPNYSFKPNTYFGQNRGVSVLFRLIHLLQRNFEANKIQIPKEQFFKDLSTVLNDDTIQRLDDYYGEGGANASAHLLISELKTKFPTKYSKMESNLNHLRD